MADLWCVYWRRFPFPLFCVRLSQMRAFLITKVSLLTDLINSFGENADDAFANEPQMPQM